MMNALVWRVCRQARHGTWPQTWFLRSGLLGIGVWFLDPPLRLPALLVGVAVLSAWRASRLREDACLPRREVLQGYAILTAIFTAFDVVPILVCMPGAAAACVVSWGAGFAACCMPWRPSARRPGRPRWASGVLLALAAPHRRPWLDWLVALLLGLLIPTAGSLAVFLCLVLRALRVRNRLAELLGRCGADALPLRAGEVARAYLTLTLAPMLPALPVGALTYLLLPWELRSMAVATSAACGLLAVAMPLLEWFGEYAVHQTWACRSASLQCEPSRSFGDA